MSEVVELERDGRVAVVSLNRPGKLNACSPAVFAGLAAVGAEVRDDGDVRAVLLRGEGRAFCAGLDMKQAAEAIRSGDSEGGMPRDMAAGLQSASSRVTNPRRIMKPVIAAVNGACLAGGCEIMLSCDLVVAVEHATFGIPEAKRGLIAGAGGLIRLPRRIPRAVALQLALTGDAIDAARAYEVGLVNKVVPADRLMDEALALAELVAANAPLAVRASKRVMLQSADLPENEAWALNDGTFGEIFTSADAMEGAVAFAEKRPPNWQGK